MNQQNKPTVENTTYAQCYGIKASYLAGVFTPRSKLIKKHWLKSSDSDYVKLGGQWKDDSYFATQANFFTATSIDGAKVNSAQIPETLTEISKQTLINNGLKDYADNISYFAGESSLAWEYPILNAIEQAQIYAGKDIFSYAKILRYAFASSYAYNLENEAAFAFIDNPVFQALMLTQGELVILKQIINENGVFAVAMMVPAVPEKGLEEEVIIAFKGTDNATDLYEDIKLALANLIETDHLWQKTAYDFCKSVIEVFPPNAESVAEGYQRADVAGTNVVLTGHSLGGYTAIDSGVRTGIQTRVFSAPGTKIIDSLSHAFANTMWLRNVINFRRNLDPVSSSITRHDENEVEFPEKSMLNPIQNHFLTPFINEIFIPLTAGVADEANKPRQIFITPNATVGAGLQNRINYWGKMTYVEVEKTAESLSMI